LDATQIVLSLAEYLLKLKKAGHYDKIKLQPKKSKFFKNWFKIGGVGLTFFSKSATNLFAQNIIEWAEK
jgi:hypothetical protein